MLKKTLESLRSRNCSMLSCHFSRTSFFAHSPSLWQWKFDTFPLVKVLAKVHCFVAKFNKSCKGTEKLIQLPGKKLITKTVLLDGAQHFWLFSAAATCFSGMWRPKIGTVCKAVTRKFWTATWSICSLLTGKCWKYNCFNCCSSLNGACHTSWRDESKTRLSGHFRLPASRMTKCFKKVKDVQTVDFWPTLCGCYLFRPYRYKLLLTPEQSKEMDLKWDIEMMWSPIWDRVNWRAARWR